MTEKTMTVAERTELGKLIRKRERVMKAGLAEQSARVLADFERQLGTIYKFDQDEIWSEATKAAEAAVEDARKAINDRCEALGIPKDFRPDLSSLRWIGRGHNAFKERRAELRAMAKTEIDAREKAARTKIERLTLEAQEQLAGHALASEAAKAFLENLPAIEDLLPALETTEVAALLEQRPKHKQWVQI
ncbi:MAG: hypothetical protein ACR2RE_28735 [Geminicoccaceae bacterium]